MWLLVLRSLAVYGGAASVLLWLARRYVAPVGLRAALVLAAAPLLFTGKAIVTGGVYAPLDIAFKAPPLSAYRADFGIGKARNPLVVDVVSQMIPWRKAVREALENGRLPLWNRFLLGGEPLLGVAQPAVFHPGTWLGLLLPLPQAWTFDMTLRIFLAALCAYLFFAGTGASVAASLLGALAWAFSDFLMFFVGYPVTPSVAPVPLLLLALWRLSRVGGLESVGLMTAALVLIAIAGHPETLLFCVTGAGIYFFFQLAWAGPGRRLVAVLRSLAAGGLAFGLSAIALLPFLEALPQTHEHVLRTTFLALADRSDEPIESLRRFLSNLLPYAYGTLGRSEVVPRFAVPVGYAGSLLFPLIATGLFTRERSKGPWLVLGALGLALSARLWGVTDLLARAPVFDIAVLEYFVFLAIFAGVALAVEGADRLHAGEGVAIFLAASVASAGGLVLLASSRRDILGNLGMRPEYLRLRILAQVAPLLLCALLAVFALRRHGRVRAGFVTALLLLFAGQRAVEEAEVYPTLPARAFYPPLPVLDPIPRDEPVRVAGLLWALVPNMSALYGLEDVRGYEPMLFAPLAETFRLWCRPQPIFYNRVDDATSPFLAFLNVRYVLAGPFDAPPAAWPEIAQDRGTRLYENPRALPRVFVPRHLVWTDLLGLHVHIMKTIGDYANDGVAGQARPGRLHWWNNGPAEVRISSYAAERMTLEVDAREETLVGTSIPAWRGWRLTIDGKRAPLVPFNRAFLSFRVSPGRHSAALRYLPDGFLYGAGLTVATLLACGVLARRARCAHR
jgi:hypothetical protein